MSDMSEKRRFTRVSTHIPVRYHKLGDTEGEEGSTIARNVSEGGVRFKAQDFVSRACRLILEIDFPMFNKPIKAISKVAWIKKANGNGDYEIGNKFLEISKKDRKLVSEYVGSLTHYNEPGSVESKPVGESVDTID